MSDPDSTTPGSLVAMPVELESANCLGPEGRRYSRGDISIKPANSSSQEHKLDLSRGAVGDGEVGEVTAELTTRSNQRSFGFKLLSNNKAAPYTLTKCKSRGVAKTAGLRNGDVLVVVAEQDVAKITKKAVQKMLKVGADTHLPVEITVLRPSGTSAPIKKNSFLARIIGGINGRRGRKDKTPAVGPPPASVEAHIASKNFKLDPTDDVAKIEAPVAAPPSERPASFLLGGAPLEGASATEVSQPGQKQVAGLSRGASTTDATLPRGVRGLTAVREDLGDLAEAGPAAGAPPTNLAPAPAESEVPPATTPGPGADGGSDAVPPATAPISGAESGSTADSVSSKPTDYLIIDSTSASETTREVVLKSDPAGYGLKFGGALTASNGKEKGWGILITDKKPGTPSASCDDIVIGWQLIRLNGVDLSQAMFGDLRKALEQVTGDQMELGLALNPGLAEAYDVTIGVAPSDAAAAAAAAAVALTATADVPAPADAPSGVLIERKETDWGAHPPVADAAADTADADIDETEIEVIEELVRRMTAVSTALAESGERGDMTDALAVLREGELTKAPPAAKRALYPWKKRHFVLAANSLMYFNKKGGAVKGGILLETAKRIRDATSAESGRHPSCFVIETPGRDFVVSASTDPNRTAWVKVLRATWDKLHPAPAIAKDPPGVVPVAGEPIAEEPAPEATTADVSEVPVTAAATAAAIATVDVRDEPAEEQAFTVFTNSQHGTRHGEMNQDSCFHRVVEGGGKTLNVCAAFDGHGLLGEQASATASRTLDILSQTLKFSNIVTSPKETMEWLFDELHKAVVEDHKSPPENYTYPGRPGSEPLDFKLVEVGGKLGKAYTCTSADGMPPAPIDYGTTAAIAVAFDDTVVIGSLGDAGAVLCHLDEGSQCTGTLLSATHTAKDPAEIERIERDFADKALITHDGYLAPLDDEMGGYEVQLTRSLGHALLGQFGISSKPEVLSLNLRKERAFGLVLCSDGVTDEFQPRDIAERVHSGEKDEVAKSLCQEAQEYCMDTDKIDDCTAVVILVNLPDLGTRCTD